MMDNVNLRTESTNVSAPKASQEIIVIMMCVKVGTDVRVDLHA